VKDITVKGDYIVVTGKQKSGAESQISLLFKTRNYPFKKNIMLRQGPPPTAKSPTVLDLVVDGCTGLGEDNAVDSNGKFVPKFLNLYGQDKNGAFDLGLLGENHISAQADELQIRPNPYLLATEGMIRFHARRRVGAAFVRPNAFRKLKMVTP